MILISEGLAVLYGTDNKSAILVANIGLSAPLILRTVASTAAQPIAEATHAALESIESLHAFLRI
jgi:hypothetical protein